MTRSMASWKRSDSATRAVSLIAAKTSGGPAASSRAVSQARARTASSSGSTSLTTPHRAASGGRHPASGQEQLHRDVVRHPLGQLDRRGVREGAGVDLRKAELGRLRGVDQVARQGQLEAAAHRQAVDRGDHRLVEVGQLLEAAEAADAVVAVDGVAVGGGLEVPAGAEELVALGAHDRHPEVGVVAEVGEDLGPSPGWSPGRWRWPSAGRGSPRGRRPRHGCAGSRWSSAVMVRLPTVAAATG